MFSVSSISYLNQGLNIIKRAEEFVENSIGEDCEFNLCEKKGLVAQEKSQHIPSSNGCGSLDFLFDDSEDSLIHVEKEFSILTNEKVICSGSMLFHFMAHSASEKKVTPFFSSLNIRLQETVI